MGRDKGSSQGCGDGRREVPAANHEASASPLQVVVYEAVPTFYGPPIGQEFIARIRCLMRSAKGKLAHDWHPVVFSGSSAEAVHERAVAWWNAELSKEAARQAGYAKAADARRAKAQASGLATGSGTTDAGQSPGRDK